jgi:4-amino-4-deoxy-L-arabinose transferase-like glycosyltransferase
MIGDIPAAVIVFLAAGTLAFLLSRRGMTKKQLTLAIIALAVAILGIATWIPWIPAGFQFRSAQQASSPPTIGR